VHICTYDTFSFCFVFGATLCFKPGLQADGNRAESEQVSSTAVSLYASIWCHFMLQVTAAAALVLLMFCVRQPANLHADCFTADQAEFGP
jgi:hypothetical protein